MFKIFIKSIVALIALHVLLGIALPYFYPGSSPYTAIEYFYEHLLHQHADLNKHVIGFLPYWKTDSMQTNRLDLLSEVNYFALTAGNDGHIIKVTGNETEPGWREWQTQAMKEYVARTHIMGTKFTFTVTAQKNDVIENILDSKSAQTNLINDIIEQVKSRHTDGVDLDFEYQGNVDEAYKEKFSEFINALSERLQFEKPDAELSLSVMPLSARGQDLFDFKKLAPMVNYFIGMSYDYYGANSEIAGPVAPMKGFAENKYFFDLTTMYHDIEKYVPNNKIIMGISSYGWDWAVTDGKTIQSKTYPQSDPKNYAAILSYARMKKDNDLKPNQCHWDDYALETWCWYTKDGVDHQVWFEDSKAIGLRYDFAKQQDLGGTAIWILGYDKNYPDLWNLIQEKFTSQ